jgi:hypothetical protein
MTTLILIKAPKIRNQRLMILKNNEKIVFDRNESKKELNIEAGDTLVVKQNWVSSQKLRFDAMPETQIYEIIPSLNNTWLTAIGAIMVIMTFILSKFYSSPAIIVSPMIVLVLYIFSYLSIFRDRYFKIRKS